MPPGVHLSPKKKASIGRKPIKFKQAALFAPSKHISILVFPPKYASNLGNCATNAFANNFLSPYLLSHSMYALRSSGVALRPTTDIFKLPVRCYI